ncbi:protein E6-like [Magnolia sinica]|uniref:protein E6-like n=1 Tax=Magnolia sinica TaxID=86752 RepID=UPI0026585FAE|nr:protein E6-like [Magnolia sinica]
MAAFPNYLSFLFLLFLTSSLQTQARNSHFFNKVTRFNTATETEPVEKQLLPFPKQEEPTTFTPQNLNGYGLYGRDPEKMSYTSTSQVTEGLPNGVGESTSLRSYQDKETTSGYPNNEYDNQKYGMSDTRFLENGRYFYDIKADTNYRNGYDSVMGNRGGYRPTRVGPTNQYNYGGYYGNNENAYEYNTSMEGYQNPRDETDEEYIP